MSMITPAIIRVKDIVTPDSDIDLSRINPQRVDQIAKLLLLSDGVLINPIIVQRQGHDCKYKLLNGYGYETYAAALSLKDNTLFRGKITCFIVGDNDNDAPIDVIQQQLAVLRP